VGCRRPPTLGRAVVGFHEQIRLKQVMGGGSSRGDHRCPEPPEALNDGFAYTSGTAGHKRALAGEFGFGGSARLCISTRTPFGRLTPGISRAR
jgi:hypothetical protein